MWVDQEKDNNDGNTDDHNLPEDYNTNVILYESYDICFTD